MSKGLERRWEDLVVESPDPGPGTRKSEKFNTSY